MMNGLFREKWMLLMVLLWIIAIAYCFPVWGLEEIASRMVIEKAIKSLTFFNLNDKKAIRAQLHITLINNQNEKQEREIAYCRTDWGNLNKSLLTVLEPASMKGIAFLAHNYDDVREKDQQWRYTRGLGHDEQIPPNEKNENFLETDFTYSDFGDWDMKDYKEYETLSPEVIDNIECYHVNLLSNENAIMKTGYGRVEVWVRPVIWMFVKIRFYDKDNQPLKELLIQNIERIDDIDTPRKFHLQNVQKHRQAIIQFIRIEYNVELDNGLFSRSRLTTGRPCFSVK